MAITGINTYQDYNYTGGIQSFAAPYKGTYKLEVWGAQGGDILITGTHSGYYRNTTTRGGYGGYSSGNIDLNQGETIYIAIGGKASLRSHDVSYGNSTKSGGAAGYNGGGSSAADHGGGGGGATHIAKTTGTLASLSSNRSSVLIVAGGGGGGGIIPLGWMGDGSSLTGRTLYMIGGSGGGTSGQSGQQDDLPNYGASAGAGGTQTTGYAFGAGASQTVSYNGGAGGGGWYGGTSGGNYNGACAGGGGSGYIGGVTSGSMSNGQRSENGLARITLSAISSNFYYNGTLVNTLYYNGTKIDKVVYNGTTVFG